MNALDKLGLAIANAGYTWTPEMREAYEKGIKEFESIRAEALEEAAKVCEGGTGNAVQANVLKALRQERERIAEVIRGLK